MIGKTNVKVKPNKRINYVDYIESTGTQYIDTGFVATSNTTVEIDFQIIGSTTTDTWQPFFGFRDYYYSPKTGMTCYYNTSDKTKLAYAYSSDDIQGNISQEVTNRTKLKFDGTGVYENGNKVISTNTYTFTATNDSNTMTIFAQKVNTPASATVSMNDRRQLMKLYSFKICENNVLVRDFKPCKDGAGVYCLYDEVEKRYFYNQGTGSFSGGASV